MKYTLEVPEMLADTGVCIDTSFSGGHIEPLSDGYWDNQDTAMMDADGFTRIIRAFGSERVLFGTDSPWADQKKSLDFVRSLPLASDELENILEKNAARLFCRP